MLAAASVGDVTDLQEVVALLLEAVRQPGVAADPGRVVAVRELATAGLQEPDDRVEPRADPLCERLDGDALSGGGVEPVEVDLRGVDVAVDGRGNRDLLRLLAPSALRAVTSAGEVVDHQQAHGRDTFVGCEANAADADLGCRRCGDAEGDLAVVLSVLFDTGSELTPGVEARPDRGGSRETGAEEGHVHRIARLHGRGNGVAGIRRAAVNRRRRPEDDDGEGDDPSWARGLAHVPPVVARSRGAPPGVHCVAGPWFSKLFAVVASCLEALPPALPRRGTDGV